MPCGIVMVTSPSSLTWLRIQRRQVREIKADQMYWIWDEYVEKQFLVHCQELSQSLYTQSLFKSAHIGRGSSSTHNTEIRGDEICWIDETQQTEIHQWIESLRNKVREDFFVSSKSYEAHFARYPAGKGYDTHIDQSQKGWSHDKRILSFVLYLNENWQNEDGGQLELFPNTDKSIKVEPIAGRLVLFSSTEVPHRVLPSTRTRWSLTGWMRG